MLPHAVLCHAMQGHAKLCYAMLVMVPYDTQPIMTITATTGNCGVCCLQDYADLLQTHRSNNADITIATHAVGLGQASFRGCCKVEPDTGSLLTTTTKYYRRTRSF